MSTSSFGMSSKQRELGKSTMLTNVIHSVFSKIPRQCNKNTIYEGPKEVDKYRRGQSHKDLGLCDKETFLRV